MKKYQYVDNQNYPDVQILLEVEAENILEADEVYKKMFGVDVKKHPWVGCKIGL